VTQTILQSSAILARADLGHGGSININLEPGTGFPQDNSEPVAPFIQDSQSLVSADAKSGNNGTVTINGLQTNFNSALAVPNVSVEKAPELAHNACQREGNRSTFVREGRGGIASGPDSYQTSPPPSEASPAAQAAAQRSSSMKSARVVADKGCQ
jgi:hypothetical protein